MLTFVRNKIIKFIFLQKLKYIRLNKFLTKLKIFPHDDLSLSKINLNSIANYFIGFNFFLSFCKSYLVLFFFLILYYYSFSSLISYKLSTNRVAFNGLLPSSPSAFY